MRALLGTASHFCEVVVLRLRAVPIGTALSTPLVPHPLVGRVLCGTGGGGGHRGREVLVRDLEGREGAVDLLGLQFGV